MEFKATEAQILEASDGSMKSLIDELKQEDKKTAEEVEYAEVLDDDEPKTETESPKKETKTKETKAPPPPDEKKTGAMSRFVLKITDVILQFLIAFISGDFDSDEYKLSKRENKDLEELLDLALEANPKLVEKMGSASIFIFIAAVIVTYIPKFISAAKKKKDKSKVVELVKEGKTVEEAVTEVKHENNLNELLARVKVKLNENEIDEKDEIPKDENKKIPKEVVKETDNERRNRLRRERYARQKDE